MFRSLFLTLAALEVSTAAFAGNWNVDMNHSEVGFNVQHMVISTVHGNFNTYTADITFDPQNPASLALNVEIDAASVNTRQEKRDGHLRSADFFDVEKTPKITFKSTKVEVVAPGKFKVTGDLTMKGITKTQVLDVVGLDKFVEDGRGNKRAAAVVTGSLNRHDFSLNWDNKIPSGDFVVSEKVDLDITMEILQKIEGK